MTRTFPAGAIPGLSPDCRPLIYSLSAQTAIPQFSSHRGCARGRRQRIGGEEMPPWFHLDKLAKFINDYPYSGHQVIKARPRGERGAWDPIALWGGDLRRPGGPGQADLLNAPGLHGLPGGIGSWGRVVSDEKNGGKHSNPQRPGRLQKTCKRPGESGIIAAWKRALPTRNSWQGGFSWC